MERLPVEVWHAIFKVLMEDVGPQGAVRQALLCGAVCRHWREMTATGLAGPHATLDLFPWHARVGDAELSRLIRQFPHLSGLVLPRCKAITDQTLISLATSECSASLTRLEVLAGNKVGSESAMHQLLTQCTRLRQLCISNSHMIKKLGLVPPAAEIGQQLVSPPVLTLEVLRLTSCENVNNTTLALIGQTCPYLRELDLTGCRKVMNEGLFRLVGLEDVVPQSSTDSSSSSSSSSSSASSQSRSEASSVHVPGCTRLEKLVLRGCFLLTPEGLLRAIPALNLRTLDISSIPNVNDEALSNLVPFLPRITTLTIESCVHVTDRGVAKLARMKTLTSLDLRGISSLSDMALPHLSALSQLSSLSLKFCNRIEGSGFMSWTMGYMSLPLRVLDLQGLSNLTDNAIETLSTSANISLLEELDLRMCILLSNRSIVHLVSTAVNLRTLRLQSQEAVDDDGIALIARHLTKLATLDLEQMPSITDLAIETLHMPWLEILSIQNCLQLAYACVRNIKERCPRLHLLNLSGCRRICGPETQELMQQIPTVIPPAPQAGLPSGLTSIGYLKIPSI